MKKMLPKLEKFFGSYQFAVYDGDNKRWIVEALPKSVGYLKAQNAKGNHIFIKPVNEEQFMLADDLDLKALERFHKDGGKVRPGRMVVETSPDNFQIWIRSREPMDYLTKRFWLQKMGSDPGCVPLNRWGRSPGFRNRKEKYRTEAGFPLSKLIWIDWKRLANVPRVTPELFPSPPSSEKARTPRPYPTAQKYLHQKSSGGECAFLSVSRSEYECGNESATDFRFALGLMRRGATDDDVKTRIVQERTEWEHHKGGNRMESYLCRTIRNARRIINESAPR